MPSAASSSSRLALWRHLTAISVLLTVLFMIFLIGSSDKLVGLRSIAILTGAIPLIWVLMGVRQVKRHTILYGQLLSFIYFCAGVIAIMEFWGMTFGYLALLYTAAVLGWFIGSMQLLRCLPSLKTPKKKNNQ